MSAYCYVFSYNTAQVADDKVYKFFEQCDAVDDWISPYSGLAILQSDESADVLSDSFDDEFGRCHHFVVDILYSDSDYSGRLGQTAWEYVDADDEDDED